jgi:hypothetical protein
MEVRYSRPFLSLLVRLLMMLVMMVVVVAIVVHIMVAVFFLWSFLDMGDGSGEGFRNSETQSKFGFSSDTTVYSIEDLLHHHSLG